MMKHTRAFSLLELAIALALTGLLASFSLKTLQESNRADCYTSTRAQLVQIEEAIDRFAMANDRLPMPARRNVGTDSTQYGKSVDFSDPSALDTVVTGGIPIYFGALPTTTLGLTMNESYDCWGNKFTYVITKDLADPARNPANQKTKYLDNLTLGGVHIKMNNNLTIVDGAGYAVISHGEDGLGAIKANDGGADKRWCHSNPMPSPVPISQQNCETFNNVIVSAPFNNNKENALTYFDDLVIYRRSPWQQTPTNGLCNNSTPGGCLAGTSAAFSSPCGTYPTWRCDGLGAGSTNDSCQYPTPNGPCVPPPENGACNLFVAGACNVGNPVSYNPGSCGGNATWQCQGNYGGATDSCTLANAPCGPTPVDGACGAGAGSCSAGTLASYNPGSCGGSTTWQCLGINGGITASCSVGNAACPVCSVGWTWYCDGLEPASSCTGTPEIRNCQRHGPCGAAEWRCQFRCCP